MGHKIQTGSKSTGNADISRHRFKAGAVRSINLLRSNGSDDRASETSISLTAEEDQSSQKISPNSLYFVSFGGKS